MEFEGHDGKQASVGMPILPAKHSPMKVTTATKLPPGHPAYVGPKRPVKATTTDSFIKNTAA